MKKPTQILLLGFTVLTLSNCCEILSHQDWKKGNDARIAQILGKTPEKLRSFKIEALRKTLISGGSEAKAKEYAAIQNQLAIVRQIARNVFSDRKERVYTKRELEEFGKLKTQLNQFLQEPGDNKISIKEIILIAATSVAENEIQKQKGFCEINKQLSLPSYEDLRKGKL